ncbi:hypothetical protein [Candidatus Entotheonella palauensis]|uniref:hypothetical protein n=1 Tax=Candidatus Entotheonella palauensis TaxID=93172 RepID=UPI000B7DF9CB|nr:hypothetical protein [Candidatus Entotheonella palauensis]
MDNILPVADAWPDGEIETGYAELDRKSARFRWTETCSRHWWKLYLEADNPVDAYAAWVLFLRSVDRRGRLWMHKDVQAVMNNEDFFDLKLSHAELNRYELKRAMKRVPFF